MSELIKNNKYHGFRWKLLTEASTLALIGYVAAMPIAKAEDSDQPTVWVELGGQLSRLQNNQEIYTPPFLALTPSGFPSPQADERPPRYGFDESGSILFQPKGSSWHFSAAVRYGRAISSKHVSHQSYPGTYVAYQRDYYPTGIQRTFARKLYPLAARLTDVRVKQSESHSILDFEAGKDMGLGLFGTNTSSSLNIGVRVAQFQSKSQINLREDPDWRFVLRTHTITGYYGTRFVLPSSGQPFHLYEGAFEADRSFRGVGPSMSLASSILLVGNSQDSELTLDWGANISVLFGRQKAKTHHHTTALYHSAGSSSHFVTEAHFDIVYQSPATPDHARSRGVAVPNVGGFAGMSFRYANAKVSFGYKADFFFGAMDGGIDVRRTEDVGFHGPYASVSIGLGG